VAYCLFHPDSQAIGVCVRCRVAICPACCTRMDGINHCHGCLKALGERRAPSTGGPQMASSLLALLTLAAAFFGVFFLARGALAP
jgi:hypothetical protein